MEVNPEAVQQLRSTEPVVKLSGIPLITGGTAEFTLLEMPIFAPDTVITEIRAGGTTASMPLPDIRTWYGTNPDNPDRALFASADAAGNIKVMVSGNPETSVTVISQLPGTNTYQIEPANLPPTSFCGVEATVAQATESQASSERESASVEPRADVIYEIEMLLDIGNNMHKKLEGDNIRLLDYLTDLFGAVNIIYQRDLKARLTLKHVYVWATPEPFVGADTFEQLFTYREYNNVNRRNVSFDLGHYFDYNPGLGGRAYLDVLGSDASSVRYGVSNIYANTNFPDDIGTYYWDTMVTAHEIGHNIGSHHTHCYYPPIDCCYVQEGCSNCTTEQPTLGTIMSYCHLHFGRGGGIDMTFHPRCISLMQPKIAASTRTGIYPHQPNAVLEGGPEDVVIPNGYLTANSLNGTLMEASMVGAPPVTRQFVVKNDGSVPLVLTGSPRVRFSGSSFLGIASQPGADTLAPGESTTFGVQFSPFVAGTYYGVVSVPTNDPDTPNYTFGVTGRVSQPAPPQTFKWNGETAIPDGDFDGISIPISVTGVPGTIRDVDLAFEGTDCSTPEGVGLEHPRIGDIALMLRSPSGTTCWVLQGSSSASGANFCNTIFDDELAHPLISTTPSDAAPYSGSYRPYETLNRFAGEDANGTWQLTAIDISSGQQGTIRSASLIITGNTSSEVSPWSLYE